MSAEAEELAKRAVAALRDKGVRTECPRCGRNAWIAFTTAVLVQPEGPGFAIPPPNIPVLALTCRTCAFMSFHNMNLLMLGEKP